MPLVIRVRLNGTLPLLFGGAHLSIALPDSASVADLIKLLVEQRPEARDSIARAIPVIRGEVASPHTPLADAQEVALLMPMSGG